MTGFTATADPATARSFTRHHRLRPRPLVPVGLHPLAALRGAERPARREDLVANVLPWKLASGPYPGRDGKLPRGAAGCGPPLGPGRLGPPAAGGWWAILGSNQ